MNLVLITSDEAAGGLPSDDARARHLRESDRLAQVAGARVIGRESGRRFVGGYQHQVHGC